MKITAMRVFELMTTTQLSNEVHLRPYEGHCISVRAHVWFDYMLLIAGEDRGVWIHISHYFDGLFHIFTFFLHHFTLFFHSHFTLYFNFDTTFHTLF